MAQVQQAPTGGDLRVRPDPGLRGKLLELREYDYVTAAKLAGSRTGAIITTHLRPGYLSDLIVRLTLAIPGMILG